METGPRPKHPWIGKDTLGLIEQRAAQAALGNYTRAEGIDKIMQKSARNDRKVWFSEKLTKDVWHPVRLLGKERPTK
eukprot:510019-Alexandrium_andersonii.AAC.1